MAKRLFEQCSVTLNGTDISADVSGMEVLTGRRAPVDVTGLSDTWDSFLVPNLRRWGVRLQYFNNFAGTSETPTGIATVLQQVLNSTNTTGVALVIRSTTNARSVNNPEWTGQVQIDGDFQQTAGGVAEADKGTVSLKWLGILVRATSTS
jgi:hypothetical protein